MCLVSQKLRENACCFKLLILGVSCYAAIDNWYYHYHRHYCITCATRRMSIFTVCKVKQGVSVPRTEGT